MSVWDFDDVIYIHASSGLWIYVYLYIYEAKQQTWLKFLTKSFLVVTNYCQVKK